MHFLKLKFTFNEFDFSNMVNSDDLQFHRQFFSFYTDEEEKKFCDELYHCVANTWLHPWDDADFYENLGKKHLEVDQNTNSLTIILIAHQIEYLKENLFDSSKMFITPLVKYIDANPSKGSYNIKIYDVNNNDVTSNFL